MPPPRLPTGAELTRRALLYTAGYSAIAVAVITLYLSGLVRLSPDEWTTFAICVGVVFAFLLPAMLVVHRGIFLDIRRCLDDRAAGVLEREALERGFSAVCDFPRYWFVWGIGWWTGGGIAVCALMAHLEPGFGLLSAAIVVGATISISFVTDMYYFFTIKAFLAPVRQALAAELGDASRRRELVRRVPLRTKLLVAMASVILVSVVFAGFLAHVNARTAVESQALRLQAGVLDSASVLEVTALESLRSHLRSTRSPIELHVLANDGRLRDGAFPLPARLLLDASGESQCDARGCASWRARATNRESLLLAYTPAAALELESNQTATFLWLLLFSTTVAVGAAYLFARDVGQATGWLERETARIAAGDLSASALYESEDEMGDLARAFEGMAENLRSTVMRVARAADRMHQSADEVADAARDVSTATEMQTRGTSEADRSMRNIHTSVEGIADSVSELDGQVDDSSTSLQELDSTGAGLSASAESLAGNVGDVASSVDHAAGAISLVGDSSQELVAVADETSSGMEEASGGMQLVKEAAGQMSHLTGHIVSLAVTGRDRVRQTIVGMEEIAASTAAVQSVVGDLAASTDEIQGIIDVIDSVADETNLLALNAAIIAAQAGESGRPFAVVADQIRDLARRVSASTKDVTEIMHRLEEQGVAANQAIERSGASVERGQELSRDAGESLDEIASSSRDGTPRIQAIEAAVDDQSRAVSFVTDQMRKLRSGADRIRQAIDEQAGSVGLLRESAGAMGAVSRRLSAATQEQSQGTTGIRQNMQSIREWVGEVRDALNHQSGACREIVTFLEELDGCAASNRESVSRLNEAAAGQQETAEELSREIARFRLRSPGADLTSTD